MFTVTLREGHTLARCTLNVFCFNCVAIILYYYNSCIQGPNEVWHIDGNDKLKKFGFCIHGCIDGYKKWPDPYE